MSVTVDANVLVYASNEADPVHGVARSLIEELAAGPGLVYLFWPTLLGYLRIVTHPGILPSPLTPPEARANISTLVQRPHFRTSGEERGFWELFCSTAGEQARGNEITDAHLVALMRQHGVATLFSRDRDFRKYDGIEVRDPFA